MSGKIRQFSIEYAESPSRWDKGLIDQASDVPSIIFFVIFYRFRELKTLYFQSYIKIKKEEFCKKLWKIITLVTSDTWLLSRWSHQPIDPATQHIILKIVGIEDWYMCTLFRKPQLPHQQGVPISWGKKGKIPVSFVKIFLGWKYPSLKNISCGVLVCKN